MISNGIIGLSGPTTDTQWKAFCQAFELSDLYSDPSLRLNNQRVEARGTIIPQIKKRLAQFTVDEIAKIFESNDLPFAKISRPDQLFEDPHLNATGGLAPVTIPNGPEKGTITSTPLLPLMMDGQRFGVRLNPPKAGEQATDILKELGYTQTEITKLYSDGIISSH